MRKFTTAILFVLITSSLYAQEVGIVVGTNFAKVDGNLAENIDTKFNFTFGLFGEFMLSDQLGIQPEVIFSGQGFKYLEDDGSGFVVERKQKLSYVNIPVMANYYVADNFALQAGPYLGVLNSAELNVTGTLGLLGGQNDNEFKSTDVGFGFGALIKSDNTNVGVRYLLGMTNISATGEAKNRVLNVFIGFRFLND